MGRGSSCKSQTAATPRSDGSSPTASNMLYGEDPRFPSNGPQVEVAPSGVAVSKAELEALEATRKEARDLIAKRDALNEELNATSEKLLEKGISHIFAQHKGLTQLAWTLRETEYDDEGPDPGISLYGIELDGERITGNEDYERFREDPRVKAVVADFAELFNLIEERFLYDHLGGYTLCNAGKGGKVDTEYYDYECDANWSDGSWP